MIRLNRSVLAVGGVILAGSLVTALNPRTVRAVEVAAAAVKATLVQVTNTASNPVVTRDVTLAPSQLVELLCRGDSASCFQVLPGGGMFPNGNSATYVVPAGQTLVITDIDVLALSSSSGGASNFALVAASGSCPSCGGYGVPLTYDVYDVPSNAATHHFSLGRGVVWPSGAAVQSAVVNGTRGVLYGYLTAN